MDTPLVSIIIPTFNSDSCIKRCLDSIVSQTFTDFEVLVMDAVSSDATLNIISSYNDSRIKVFSEPDKGIYDAMNKGIVRSQGEWLYFIGSDDYLLHKEVLQNIVSLPLEQYDVVYGEVESNLSEKNKGEWTIQTIEYNRCHQAIFYKKNLFDKYGFYNLRYKSSADHDFNLNWLLDETIKKRYIPLQIAHFSCGGFSSTNGDDGFLNYLYEKILQYDDFIIPIEKKIDCVYKKIKLTKCVFKKIQLYFIFLNLRITRIWGKMIK